MREQGAGKSLLRAGGDACDELAPRTHAELREGRREVLLDQLDADVQSTDLKPDGGACTGSRGVAPNSGTSEAPSKDSVHYAFIKTKV
jgi:hypothetical protein